MLTNSFKITFNPQPKIEITGSVAMFYLIEIYEYRNGEKQFITDLSINTNNWVTCLREWYGDYCIEVWQWDEINGMIKVFESDYDDDGKDVLINLDTGRLNEAIVWYESALEYKKQHGCNLFIKTNHKDYIADIDPSVKFVDNVNNDNYYAIYNIGKYDTEFEWNKRLTETLYSKVFTKNREYCSYRNPRDWHNLSMNDVADDILGLNKF